MGEFDFIDRSASNAEKHTLKEKLFGTQEVLPMWVADMDIATPSCVLEAVHDRLEHPIIGYEIMSKTAYEAQRAWLERHHGWKISTEWLSYSPSVVASIGCAIRAFSDEGDEVIVQSPVYPPFYDMVRSNNRKLLLNALVQDNQGEYRFDLEDLKAKITPKTKLLLLCSPHNPVGRVWTRDELIALGELCVQNGIIIISDEVHCDIVFSESTHIPLASISQKLGENAVTLIGPGKTFNMAGFSISTVAIASSQLRERYRKEQHKVHYGDGAVLSHVAFEAAYRQGDVWYQNLMSHLNTNRAMIEQWCVAHPIIGFRKPQGTYLAWLDCRALKMGDRELRDFFVQEAGLGLSAGLSFGKEGSGHMRLNFAVANDVLRKALEQLSHALEKNGYG
ncbi:MAG: pyridoxal phosphate-dependent aminotransferase [Sulfuricurvum sp.]|nr:pyridoxal phosphate-dependent aminotransferase [Sulfuricurvum sp.]MDP3022625.1 pyridoxal phosphate-dependent aminotransferase [Sulfuricurvum sp.]MDP3120972.1 pyridoxal phosphate-dependent aminotransferase [Sulfuricurvum sp.]